MRIQTLRVAKETNKVHVIITSPSLNPDRNISGISAVVAFILSNNAACRYMHFTLGKADRETRGISWFLNLIKQYLKWAFVISTRPHSIVHFNIGMDRRGIIRDYPLILVARLFRHRIIVHIHGGEFLTGCRMPGWVERLSKIVLAKGPIIVLSEKERAAIGRIVPNTRILVLPNCIDLGEAQRFERRFFGDAGLTILFLSRIAESKGLQAIYQALTASHASGIKFRFVMAGAGPDEDSYVRQFRELLGSDFHFAGPVTGCAKTSLLKSCDVFLLPSLYEGLPMALLEGMAFGLVPITTSVGSISDIVRDGDNGIIVDRNAPGEIASAIKRLSFDREYMGALGRRARQSIFEFCNAQEYISHLNAVYSDDEYIDIPCCN